LANKEHKIGAEEEFSLFGTYGKRFHPKKWSNIIWETLIIYDRYLRVQNNNFCVKNLTYKPAIGFIFCLESLSDAFPAACGGVFDFDFF